MRACVKGAVISGALVLAGLGLTGCGKSHVNNPAAVKFAMNRCMKTSSKTFCDCLLQKMQSAMKPDEYTQWLNLQLAVKDATSVDDAIKRSGLSRDEWTKLNSKFAGYGAAAGVQCEGKSAG